MGYIYLIQLETPKDSQRICEFGKIKHANDINEVLATRKGSKLLLNIFIPNEDAAEGYTRDILRDAGMLSMTDGDDINSNYTIGNIDIVRSIICDSMSCTQNLQRSLVSSVDKKVQPLCVNYVHISESKEVDEPNPDPFCELRFVVDMLNCDGGSCFNKCIPEDVRSKFDSCEHVELCSEWPEARRAMKYYDWLVSNCPDTLTALYEKYIEHQAGVPV
jgi:hypothetical protein